MGDAQAYLMVPSWEARRRAQAGMPQHAFGTRHAPPAATPWPWPRHIPLVTAKQVHGDHVIIVTPGLTEAPGGHQGDALMTGQAGQTVGVFTADCLPILLADPVRGAVAAVHAGWRGSLRRIAQKAVATMAATFGSLPGQMMAALGPAIGRCCYEVGLEVLEPLRREFPYWRELVDAQRNEVKKHRLDLRAWNRRQLEEAGVRQIDDLTLCTACRPDLFYSYRRDGLIGQDKQGRGMLSGIMVTPPTG